MKLKLVLTTAIVVMAVALLGATSAQAAPFVYVTNSNSANVSQYDAAGGALAPLSPATVATGTGPIGVSVSPDGRNAYVTRDSPAPAVLQYAVAPDGTLTLKSSATLPADALPGQLAVSPNGKSVYVINRFQPLLQYTVEPDGSLTPKSPATVPTGPGPTELAVSPDSRSVYVTNGGGGQPAVVSQYTAAADGTLTPKSPPTVPAGGNDPFAEPVGVAVSPNGTSVYAANFEGFLSLEGSVFQYTVGADGTLSPKSPAAVPAGHPVEVAVSPDGKSVYASSGNSIDPGGAGTVRQFSVGPDGTLTPKSPLEVAAENVPFGIAISGDGESVYVANAGSDSISQYAVGADGSLSPRSPDAVAAGSNPLEIAVTPLPRAPTSKEQCKDSGWRDFQQFKNQGQCVAVVERGQGPQEANGAG